MTDSKKMEMTGQSYQDTENSTRPTKSIGNRRQTEQNTTRKPTVFVPGGKQKITTSAVELGNLLAATGDFFCRSGVLVKKVQDDNGELILQKLDVASLPSTFESVANIKVSKNNRARAGNFTKASAELILQSDAFFNCIPRIKGVSACPLLVESAGELKVVSGYDANSCVLTSGVVPPVLNLDEARDLLCGLLKDFNFASQGDRSRALAALITPALVMGGLLSGRAPIDLGEANESQSGKGYRNKLTAAVYRTMVISITQRSRGGVGSMEESFNKALIDGRTIISLDNVRGKIDSPALESFMTEDVYIARSPYMKPIEFRPNRVVLMITSNKAEVTDDLSNRSSIVRILKQPADYAYASFAEGDLIDHVRANQPKYLAAVFAVVKAWYQEGKPTTHAHGHDFHKWTGVMDWIVQNLLYAAPLLEGHQDAQNRVSNPHIGQLNDMALAVLKGDKLDQWLRVAEIMKIMADAGIELPGIKEEQTIENDDVHKVVQQQVGRKLAKGFQATRASESNTDSIKVYEHLIERKSLMDNSHNKGYVYRFSSSLNEDSGAFGPVSVYHV